MERGFETVLYWADWTAERMDELCVVKYVTVRSFVVIFMFVKEIIALFSIFKLAFYVLQGWTPDTGEHDVHMIYTVC
jgi:hypothetical protein